MRAPALLLVKPAIYKRAITGFNKGRITAIKVSWWCAGITDPFHTGKYWSRAYVLDGISCSHGTVFERPRAQQPV
jgi:hypothetical protein